MIDWNALHAACVDRISFYKKAAAIQRNQKIFTGSGKYNNLAARYEALLEFIDTRIQTSINQPV